MNIIKSFDDLKGWINYRLNYSDGSNGIEQFSFKDFWGLRYHLGEKFLKELKEEYEYDDITLVEIHIQDKDNKFHVHIDEDTFEGCCHNEIDDALIEKNFTKQMANIKETVKRAKDLLDAVK